MDADRNCLKFPVLRPPAEVLVDSLLAGASVTHSRESDAAVVTYRVTDALTQLTSLRKHILSSRFPTDGAAPQTHERIAGGLNLLPDPRFEEELIEKFGVKVITPSDVATLEAEALQALRPRPSMTKPGNEKRRLAIVSKAA